MSSKKTTPERRPSASRKAESAAELARLISAVLTHPALPSRLYEVMKYELVDMSSDIDYETPEMVARSLEAYEQKERRRKGGE